MDVAAQEQSTKPGSARADAAPLDPAELSQHARAYTTFKAAAEWLAALALLMVTLPLLVLLAAVLMCTSRGPVIYTQTRLGRHGRPFRLYKLRTMADRCEDATGPVWSVQSDPRATTFGRWLRATHLDELPQLWNVIRGEMSLIGPRPERPEIADQIERVLPAFRHRLRVRPGLSGLAQVLLPPDADLHTVRFKLAHDLEYIRRIGPGLDLRIALSTSLLVIGLGGRTSRSLVKRFGSQTPIEAPKAAPMLRLTAPMFATPLPAPATVELSKAA